MFKGEAYRNIFETVKSDVVKVEERLLSFVPQDNSFYEDLYNFLVSPSKRIRSVLAILYLKARGVEITENTITMLSLVELIHNASLIHDDVIDNDIMRRSGKTLNSKLGNKMAVIGGDYLLAFVMQELSRFEDFELLKIFSKTIRDMCEGEILQYSNIYKLPSMENYLEKTYKKTGSLFETSIVSALLASCEKSDCNAINFGKNFGIAFQIKDDICNILNGGKDVADGVYNAPVIFSGDVNNAFAGIEKTQRLLNNYLDDCRRCILDIDDNLYKLKILELLELLNG